MDGMDHETALKTGAAGRYAGGELSSAERDAFEEHYFTCPVCADDVKAEFAFDANARAVARSFRPAAAKPVPWFWAWRPSFVVPMTATLVLVLGFTGWQNAALRRDVRELESPGLSVPLPADAVRRGDEKVFQVPRGTRVLPLSFVLPRTFERYEYEIAGDTPGGVHRGTLPPPAGVHEDLILTVPLSRLQPGSYRVALFGVNGTQSVEAGHCRIQILE